MLPFLDHKNYGSYALPIIGEIHAHLREILNKIRNSRVTLLALESLVAPAVLEQSNLNNDKGNHSYNFTLLLPKNRRKTFKSFGLKCSQGHKKETC